MADQIYDRAEQQMTDIFGEAWEDLSEATRAFLLSAAWEMVVHSALRASRPDHSAIALYLAKALETELDARVIEPLKDRYWNDFAAGRIRDTTSDSFGLLAHKGNHTLSLSQCAKLLGALKRLAAQEPETFEQTEMAGFLKSFRHWNYLLGSNFLSELSTVAKKFRNGCAHTEPLSFEQARTCYEMMVGTPAQRGFLPKLANALRPCKRQRKAMSDRQAAALPAAA